ncbi:hypothetical protein D9O29_05120 [Pantoea vagans]|uniref:Uncharacterized protein n=1 Tax=Pantoea vagans TaxID=470934 RepID=A0ABY3LHF9_9GAMM|nr:hypothetical protein D9O29_05120 [Pantoea vagans]
MRFISPQKLQKLVIKSAFEINKVVFYVVI